MSSMKLGRRRTSLLRVSDDGIKSNATNNKNNNKKNNHNHNMCAKAKRHRQLLMLATDILSACMLACHRDGIFVRVRAWAINSPLPRAVGPKVSYSVGLVPFAVPARRASFRPISDIKAAFEYCRLGRAPAQRPWRQRPCRAGGPSRGPRTTVFAWALVYTRTCM
jgi:hypothetical protein